MDLDAPILEFDPSPTAVIEPNEVIDPIDIPPHVVLCFFQDVIQDVVERHGARQIDVLISEIGHNPVYELELDGSRLALVHPGVGAPLAAAFLEELIARGCRAFVACGGAGVLVPDVALGHVIVPTAAVRDEGTSYHYLAPQSDRRAVAGGGRRDPRHAASGTTCRTSRGRRGPPTLCIARREERCERRVAEGCLTVEMEAAAFFAVARVPRRHLRATALRRRRSLGRRVGWARLGRAPRGTRAAVPAGGRGGARPLVP